MPPTVNMHKSYAHAEQFGDVAMNEGYCHSFFGICGRAPPVFVKNELLERRTASGDVLLVCAFKILLEQEMGEKR